MPHVPGPVDDAFDFWKAGNGQGCVRWSRDGWIRRLGEREVLRKLPDRLCRMDVVDVFAAVRDEESAEDAFITAMIWGFGRVGYGAWRTQRILEANPDAPARLLSIDAVTKAEGGPAGFDEMARRPLKYLGVAFGTKYLFFSSEASKESVPAAPVLDRIIRSWLAENVQMRLDIWSWKNPQHYRDYCEQLQCWGDARGMTPGQAEEAIFDYAMRGPRSPGKDLRPVSDVLDELARMIERSELGEVERDRASGHLEQLGELLDDDLLDDEESLEDE